MSTRKVTRFGAVFTVVTLASLGATSAANADPQSGFNVPDKNHSVSLTVHKHEGNEKLDKYTGQQQQPQGKAIAGVTFTVQEAGFLDGSECKSVDLALPASWEKIAKAKPDSVCLLNDPVSMETNETGIAEFKQLSQKLYKVTETAGGKNLIKTPSAPFLVTLPMPVDPNKWVYDVHAYPKNVLTELDDFTKKAADPADEKGTKKFVPGALITWTIDATIPKVAFDYTEVTMTDTVPAGLQFKAVKSVKLNAELLTSTEYTVTDSKIVLTEKGLAKLNPAAKKNDVKVTVELDTTVTDAISDGKTTNKVQLSLNGKTKDANGDTYWGSIQLTKQDKDAPNTKLADAVFSIYEGKCEANGAVVAENLKTDQQGVFKQKLYIGNKEDATKDYCLKETAAPAGYILDSTGIDFTLSVANDQFTKNVTFDNVKVTGPHLPLTGAQGTALLTGAGILLLAVGAGTVYHARRRS
ncbi:SpaH/EbpB family LPXTG-anchored major pilin [Trueperella pyogenes]|uniref:SpaH/EbpB family LPXTG-anchored major pilin n=1 Tax=Trueperella pyogenes TaxID=1661 RepID=UPI0024C0AE7F|nr:SpaH/EbpB family LPXTG-anchored major pilin [Trueperella pyogenes]WHU59626.1 SpaH/EbpB family LPXTG-anchored major pilin [Trueperella pyogenes]